MVEDENDVKQIVQQVSAIRSALTQTLYEEFFCALERIVEKRGFDFSEKDMLELRTLLKTIK